MTPERMDESPEAKQALQELTSRVLACPGRRGQVIKHFYAEKVAAGQTLIADYVLLAKSISDAAVEDQVTTNSHTNHLREAKPLLMVALIGSFVIALVCIAAALYALKLKLDGHTELSFLGMHLSSGSVAVALAALGVLAGYAAVRPIVKRTAMPK